MKKTIAEYKPIILGIDHGYGNIKTAHRVFLTGVDRLAGEAITDDHILRYNGVSYAIGESHLTYLDNKTQDENFYILTLAAIAEELHYRHMNEANLILAVGLPLTWMKTQQQSFREYLRQDRDPEFSYKGVTYRVHIHRVMIFAQGLAEALCAGAMQGDNLIVDIGNGTMNIARVIDSEPIEKSLSTENYGVSTCVRKITAALSKTLGRSVDERIIESLLRNGCDGRPDDIARITRQIACEYTAEIMKRLAVHGYDGEYMNLFVFGGGGCLLKHYGDISSKKNVTVIDDICANAKAYETMAQLQISRRENRKTA